MIVDVPTPAEFQTAGLNQLYLAWQIAISAVQGYDGAIAWGAEDDRETRDEYWRRTQPALANAYSLIQQAMELALKGRIAEVSPFLLLGDPGRWPASAAAAATSFGEFRTLDATELVKVHNCVRTPPLDPDFSRFWDEVRRVRNTIMHSATPRSFDPGDVLRAILHAAEALFAETRWPRRLLDMEEQSSAAAFGFHDSLQNNVMHEVELALRHLNTSDARRFLDFDPRQRAYLCPVCYQHANHDAQDEWPALAQLERATPGSTTLTCIVCESVTAVDRIACLYPSCEGDVLADDQCLTCTQLQSHCFDVASGLVVSEPGKGVTYQLSYGQGHGDSSGPFAIDRQRFLDDEQAKEHGAFALRQPHLHVWTTVSISIDGKPRRRELWSEARVLGHWRRDGEALTWIDGLSAYMPKASR